MNHSDSEKITTRLNSLGHKAVKADSSAEASAKAELIVINACSVRQSAIHRVYGKVENYKDKKIIVAGCVLPKDKKQLLEKNVEFWHPDEYFCLPPTLENSFSASVPIMTGCNNFCTYCVVPFTRGREKSRPAKEIIAEIKKRLKDGAREITLLGQNVNSYRDLCDRNSSSVALAKEDTTINFPKLLRLINALPGDFWLSFLTSHPKDMSAQLIETVAKCQKITPYVHLPIQSGDDQILRKMNRRYNAAHYKNLVKKIRLAFKRYRPAFPSVAISTDVIVGFPGETKKQFENTAKIMRELKFDMAYLARYSPRHGNAAFKLKDNVPPKEKSRRETILNTILTKTVSDNNKQYLGQKVMVLIRETKNGFALGKTATFKTVKISNKNLRPGDLVQVKITKTLAWGLAGKTE
jgi:tRNA-2-methylthio-N6-dimethylallyladenosine synthase